MASPIYFIFLVALLGTTSAFTPVGTTTSEASLKGSFLFNMPFSTYEQLTQDKQKEFETATATGIEKGWGFKEGQARVLSVTSQQDRRQLDGRRLATGDMVINFEVTGNAEELEAAKEKFKDVARLEKFAAAVEDGLTSVGVAANSNDPLTATAGEVTVTTTTPSAEEDAPAEEDALKECRYDNYCCKPIGFQGPDDPEMKVEGYQTAMGEKKEDEPFNPGRRLFATYDGGYDKYEDPSAAGCTACCAVWDCERAGVKEDCEGPAEEPFNPED